MIQRIQTIFLFLAGAASLGLFLLPFASTDEVQTDSVLFADAAFNVQDNTIMMGVFAACGLLLVLTVFLFNNRKLQMKLTLLGLFLALIGVGVSGYFLSQDTALKLAEPAIGVILPLLTFVFAVLAHRYINKDEKLVKSVDRLR